MKWFKNRNEKYASVSHYVIWTVILSYVGIKIVNHIGSISTAMGSGLSWLMSVLAPLAMGFAFAYLLYPVMKIVRKLLQKVPKISSRAHVLSVFVTVILTLMVLILLASMIVSALTREIRLISFDDVSQFFNDMIASLRDVYATFNNKLAEINISSDELNKALQSVASQVGAFFENLGTNLIASLSNVAGIGSKLLFALIFQIYFMLDGEGLRRYWKKALKALLPEKGYKALGTFIHDCDGVFAGYIRGQLLDALFMGVVISVALLFLNVKFAVIIGVMTGIGNLVPYLGPFVAYGMTAVVCLLSGDLRKLLVSVIVLFIIQTVDGNIINPKLVSSNVNVHPMLTIAALLIGSAVGGIWGMLLAVPVAALIKIYFDRFIESRRRQKEVPITKKRSITEEG